MKNLVWNTTTFDICFLINIHEQIYDIIEEQWN